jgi:hypothetical protein
VADLKHKPHSAVQGNSLIAGQGEDLGREMPSSGGQRQVPITLTVFQNEEWLLGAACQATLNPAPLDLPCLQSPLPRPSPGTSWMVLDVKAILPCTTGLNVLFKTTAFHSLFFY